MSIQIHGILYSYPHLCIIQQTACLHNSFFIHAADILMTTRIIYFIYSHPFLPFTPVFVLSSALTSWQKSKPLPRSKHGLLECRMKAFRYWLFRYFYPNRLKKRSKAPPFSPENWTTCTFIHYNRDNIWLRSGGPSQTDPALRLQKNEAHTGIQNSIDRACSICSQDFSFPVSERPASKSLLLPQCIAVKYC